MTADRIRRKIFERILLVGLFLFPAVIPLTYYLGHEVLSILEGIYALFLTGLFFALRKNSFNALFLINFATVSSFIFLCGVSVFADPIFIYWLYLYPVIVYYLLGFKRGAVVNIFFGSLMASVLLVTIYLKQLLPETAAMMFLSFIALSYISSILELSRYRMENRLRALTNTDFLTEILNRKGFEEALHTEVENSRRYKSPFCLIFLDIDHYSAICNNYGSEFGNRVLQKFTECISQELRATDQFFRTGSEEFAIILKNTKLDGAKFLSRRILGKIRDLRIKPLHEITTSIGVIQYSEISNAEDLMKRAVKMLYKAKSNGRNRIEYQDLKRNLAG